MRVFVDSAAFDPQRYDGEFVTATNELQGDLLLPPLLARCERRHHGCGCGSSRPTSHRPIRCARRRADTAPRQLPGEICAAR
jgi:hypothetical protein